MNNCELCGKPTTTTIKAQVEGTMLSVCQNCSKYGNVVSIEEPTKKKTQKVTQEPTTVKLITKNYAEKIRQAREKMKLSQEILAKNIKEKESYLHKIEAGHLEPSLITARRLEQALHITLIENYEQQPQGTVDFTTATLTIGDLLTIKKKK